MSKVKKILAMVLSLAMIMGMSVTTFAAYGETETTNVVVSVTGNGIAESGGATLKYEQIVGTDTDNSTNGWKFLGDFGTNFDNMITIDQMITLAETDKQTDGTPNKNAANGTLTTSSELAAALESIPATSITKVMTDNKFTADKAGLYVINASRSGYTYSPMLVYVPFDSTTPIAVTAKGTPDQVRKIIELDGESVAPGAIEQYTVTARYPYVGANYTSPVFTVEDELTNATFFIDADHPVNVTVGSTPLTVDTNYSLSEAHGTASLTVDFVYNRAYAGNEVQITYYAKANNDISDTKLMQNKVTSTTQPSSDAQPTSKTEYIVISDTVKLEFTKVDSTDTTKGLPGAEFQLYEGTVTDGVGDGTPVGTPVESDADGLVKFNDLDAQKNYYIVETKAPTGYSRVDAPYVLERDTTSDTHNSVTTDRKEDGLTITTITTTHAFVDDFHVNYDTTGIDTITNTTLSALPSTGGIGTTIFTIGGCIIMILAAAAFFFSRKKSKQQ